MTFGQLRAAAILVLLASQSLAQTAPRIAIIIDDLGYQLAAGHRAVALPGPVACAILPGTPGAARLARAAWERGKEVLLHLPLQSVDHDGAVEPGTITLDMTREAFADTFASAMASVPFAVGVNGHRGSLLTRHPGHMSWLMEELMRTGGLYFVDSYTTHRSVALQIASEQGVPAIKRDVFLDADPAPEMVAMEFERLKALARERGLAVAIGHPYPGTLAFLERAIPGLVEEGIELVSLRELIHFP
ncbi:MAG TPA: divergent polysaccharide deacetylase family protein [Woeseiaceae bacterium]|nr:divergent polysaccharide deacetylase family protein [Woeseiaceae bacterium]